MGNGGMAGHDKLPNRSMDDYLERLGKTVKLSGFAIQIVTGYLAVKGHPVQSLAVGLSGVTGIYLGAELVDEANQHRLETGEIGGR